MIVNSS